MPCEGDDVCGTNSTNSPEIPELKPPCAKCAHRYLAHPDGGFCVTAWCKCESYNASGWKNGGEPQLVPVHYVVRVGLKGGYYAGQRAGNRFNRWVHVRDEATQYATYEHAQQVVEDLGNDGLRSRLTIEEVIGEPTHPETPIEVVQALRGGGPSASTPSPSPASVPRSVTAPTTDSTEDTQKTLVQAAQRHLQHAFADLAFDHLDPFDAKVEIASAQAALRKLAATLGTPTTEETTMAAEDMLDASLAAPPSNIYKRVHDLEERLRHVERRLCFEGDCEAENARDEEPEDDCPDGSCPTWPTLSSVPVTIERVEVIPPKEPTWTLAELLAMRDALRKAVAGISNYEGKKPTPAQSALEKVQRGVTAHPGIATIVEASEPTWDELAAHHGIPPHTWLPHHEFTDLPQHWDPGVSIEDLPPVPDHNQQVSDTILRRRVEALVKRTQIRLDKLEEGVTHSRRLRIYDGIRNDMNTLFEDWARAEFCEHCKVPFEPSQYEAHMARYHSDGGEPQVAEGEFVVLKKGEDGKFSQTHDYVVMNK